MSVIVTLLWWGLYAYLALWALVGVFMVWASVIAGISWLFDSTHPRRRVQTDD